MMTSMTSGQIEEALDALTAGPRSLHRAIVKLLARTQPDVAAQISRSHSAYFDLAGKREDPANRSYAALSERLGPINDVMPPIAVATVPHSALWAATGALGDTWLVAIPLGVISFYRQFCTIVLTARDLHAKDSELRTSIAQMSRLFGEHLEFGLVDLSGAAHLPDRRKPIIEHLTQLAYEFFILHEACHARERHQEPNAHATTWYQEAHMRHSNEFSADAWAFNTLLSSFSNDLHLVTLSICLLFDALDALDRFDFAPMARVTHPSPAARKWHLRRLLEPPEALHFLDEGKLEEARDFSLLYERLASFIVDRACPTTPLNDLLNRGVEAGKQAFVGMVVPMMAQGNPDRIVQHLSRVRGSTQDWADAGTSEDAEFAVQINGCIDALASELKSARQLRELAAMLHEAAAMNDESKTIA